jgi:hypothetical protein
MRVFWHPYTDDSEEVRIEVTGWTGAHILASAAKVMPVVEDCHRIDRAIENCSPFFDPNLGCLLYIE